MKRREYSLLLRLYKDPKQYEHAYSIGALIEYYNSTPAGHALKKDYGYKRYDAIYDALHNLRVPRIFYGRSSCLFDFYTHDGVKLVRTGWLRLQDKISAI